VARIPTWSMCNCIIAWEYRRNCSLSLTWSQHAPPANVFFLTNNLLLLAQVCTGINLSTSKGICHRGEVPESLKTSKLGKKLSAFLSNQPNSWTRHSAPFI
jgi:hypothetical protein